LQRSRRRFRDRAHAGVDKTFEDERARLKAYIDELVPSIQGSIAGSPKLHELATAFAALTNPEFRQALHDAVDRDLVDVMDGGPLWQPMTSAEHEAELAAIAATIREHRAVIEARRLDREAKERDAEARELERSLGGTSGRG